MSEGNPEHDKTEPSTQDVYNPKLRVELLNFLWSLHEKHGLRSENYTEYRRYLTHRLARLYKEHGLKHGKGRYVKKPLNKENATLSAHVLIILLTAERSWALAEDRNQDVMKRPDIAHRASRHIRSRMRKCVRICSTLEEVCTCVTDEVTLLECRVYKAEMKARGAMMADKLCEARVSFQRCHDLYTKLKSLYDEDSWIIALDRMRPIEELFRHCLYVEGKEVDSTLFHTLRTCAGQGALQWAHQTLIIHHRQLQRMVERLADCEEKAKELTTIVGIPNESTIRRNAEVYDRLIAVANEFINKIEVEIRTESDDRRQLYLMLHCVKFRLCRAQYRRTLMHIRFYEFKNIPKDFKTCLDLPSSICSDLVRLYRSLIDECSEICEIPGMDLSDQEYFEALHAYGRGAALYYRALVWFSVQESIKGVACIREAETLLASCLKVEAVSEIANSLCTRVRGCKAKLQAEAVLSKANEKKLANCPTEQSVWVLPHKELSGEQEVNAIERMRASKEVCLTDEMPQLLTMFPKPTFYDIAGSFVMNPEPENGYSEDVKEEHSSSPRSWLSSWL